MNSRRLDRTEYFMQIAELTAKRGTCDRAQVGAVAVKDKRVIMSAYNGSPPGMAHCDDAGHLMDNGHCVRTIHAEQNIITQCAKNGISLDEATIYVTHEPCFECLKLMISAGVDLVVFRNPKRDLRTPLSYYKELDTFQLKNGKLVDPHDGMTTLNQFEPSKTFLEWMVSIGQGSYIVGDSFILDEDVLLTKEEFEHLCEIHDIRFGV